MTISATVPQSAPLGRRIKRFMSDYPLVPLIILSDPAGRWRSTS